MFIIPFKMVPSFSCISNIFIRTGNHCPTLNANEVISVIYCWNAQLFLFKGMDPITRQVGQHIEMEPEWEAAFTLQMKLTLVISMMQDWCALDVSFFWIVFSMRICGYGGGGGKRREWTINMCNSWTKQCNCTISQNILWAGTLFFYLNTSFRT